MIDEANEKGKSLYWVFDGWENIYIYTDSDDKVSSESPWVKEQRIREKREALIEDLEETAYQCRLDFVKNYTGKKEELTCLLEELFNRLADWYDVDENDIAELLGIDSLEEDEEIKSNKKFRDMVCNQPQRVALAYLFLQLDSINENYTRSDFHDRYTGNHSLRSDIKLLYDILGCIGYDPSSDELNLIQGTHPVFKQMSEVTDDEH